MTCCYDLALDFDIVYQQKAWYTCLFNTNLKSYKIMYKGTSILYRSFHVLIDKT